MSSVDTTTTTLSLIHPDTIASYPESPTNSNTSNNKLPDKYSKMQLFGYWFSKQLESLDPTSVHNKLCMFDSSDRQIEFLQPFFDNIKSIKKEFVAIQKNHNKPEKVRKPRKNKKNNSSDEAEPDFISELVEIANSDAIPENITGEPVDSTLPDTSEKEKKQKKSRKGKNQNNPLVSLLNNLQSDDNNDQTENNTNITNTTEQVVETIEPLQNEGRRAELLKMTGQQLRDILSTLRGQPTGQKSSPGAKNIKALIELIITIENKKNTTEPVTSTIEQPSTETIELEPAAITTVVVEKKKIIKKKAKKPEETVVVEQKVSEPENTITNELSYEAIDTNSLYTFHHNDIEYLRDDDYNLYSCDTLKKIGRFENDTVIDI